MAEITFIIDDDIDISTILNTYDLIYINESNKYDIICVDNIGKHIFMKIINIDNKIIMNFTENSTKISLFFDIYYKLSKSYSITINDKISSCDIPVIDSLNNTIKNNDYTKLLNSIEFIIIYCNAINEQTPELCSIFELLFTILQIPETKNKHPLLLCHIIVAITYCIKKIKNINKYTINRLINIMDHFSNYLYKFDNKIKLNCNNILDIAIYEKTLILLDELKNLNIFL